MKYIKLFEEFDIDKIVGSPPLKTGKEHSEKYENDDKEFASYLRREFYNTKMSNQDVAELRAKWKKENNKE